VTSTAAPRLDIVIPVYNEAHVLEASLGRLAAWLGQHLAAYDWRIVVANNASTDATLDVAQAVAAREPRVSVLHLDEKGRGRALKTAWGQSDAAVMAYMDVDLSTDLKHLEPMAARIARGECAIAIGNRLARDSATRRSFRREFISRSYNLIVRSMFRSRIIDAQCGFKAINREVADRLLPLVEDTQWFFDTELLLLAEDQGYAICQIPVAWIEDPDSRVKVVKTAREDLEGLWRLRNGGLARARAALAADGASVAPARPPLGGAASIASADHQEARG
jgi:glycosyltransferase involved in cell wall biosynthesis